MKKIHIPFPVTLSSQNGTYDPTAKYKLFQFNYLVDLIYQVGERYGATPEEVKIEVYDVVEKFNLQECIACYSKILETQKTPRGAHC